MLEAEGEALARLCVLEYAAAREQGASAWREWPDPVRAESERIVDAGLSEASRFVRERWERADDEFVPASAIRAELDKYNGEQGERDKPLGIFAINGVLRELTRAVSIGRDRGWRLRWVEEID